MALTTMPVFSGVKIEIHLLSGESLHIREFRGAKVGDIAVGISSQVSLPLVWIPVQWGVQWDI